MGARLPSGAYLAQTWSAGVGGYAAGVSNEQTPEPAADTRPSRLTAAAGLAALEGLALVAGGAYMLVMGLLGSPDKPEQAEMGGLTLLVLALLPLLAARGLMKCRAWSRGPAIITQIMALPVAWTLLRSEGSLLIPAGIALAVVAVASLVLLVNPETNRALGIRGPRDA